jgi:hypothetical protein
MRTLPVAFIFLLLTSVTTLKVAHAASAPIKPGLWEMKNEQMLMDGKPLPDMSAKMEQAMKNMPPEMRAQMQSKMKSMGVEMVNGAGAGSAVRMCLSKEMVEQDHWQKPQAGCSIQSMTRSGNTMKWAMACTQPPGHGEGTTTFNGTEAFSTQVNLTTQHNGRTGTMNMKSSGKWLGANCGDIKPMNVPKH